VSATGNITGGNLITSGNIEAGNIKVTGIEAVTTLNVSGDTLISGNLTVSGNTITANVSSIIITDPILGLGRGANGNALTSNDGLDRGTEMFYFTTAERIAFMGFDNSEGKMLSAANVNIANNIVTVNSLGTTVVGTLEATVVSATGNVSGGNLTTAGLISATGNITGGNLNTAGAVTGNGRALISLSASNIDTGTLAQARLANAAVTLGNTALTLGATVTTVAGLSSVTSTTFVGALTGAATTAGTVTTAAQPNITSVGTLTALTVTGNVTGGNLITAGLVSLSSITKTGSNGVGNIGSSTSVFDTVFAKATSAQYADLAEMYEADQPIEPGVVVCFGGAKEVEICNIDACSRVAGVVSTNPSYLMNSGQTGDYVVAVALTGRVPVRVTGRVRKGDMMVSAGDGRARAETNPDMGTVIGKALADFNGGDGVIEVVVGRL
jgi:hypothetical protein